MGRHSAPDDGVENPESSVPGATAGPTESSAAVLTTASRPGRHSRSDAPDTNPASVAAASTDQHRAVATWPVDLDAPAGSSAGPAAPDLLAVAPTEVRADSSVGEVESAAATRPRGRGTAADVALIRQHGGVRARVVAGVLVPFVVYAAVLAAIGATVRDGLLWIFIPLVVAGVLVGVFLDVGHKQHGATGPSGVPDDTPSSPPGPAASSSSAPAPIAPPADH